MAESVPSDRELEALKILWEQGLRTVREIWERLQAQDQRLAYTTVLSLLQVMEQKALVGHEPVGKAYAYFAKVEPRGDLSHAGDRVPRQGVRRGVGRVSGPCVGHRRASAEELERLEQMIAAAKQRTCRRGEKGPGNDSDVVGVRVAVGRFLPGGDRVPAGDGSLCDAYALTGDKELAGGAAGGGVHRGSPGSAGRRLAI